ncbi:hypothetical protein PINS_up009014 [Pythium insidiosum]|nr:hypothetical protein PINS_up009014 [Pythium insidiosum]
MSSSSVYRQRQFFPFADEAPNIHSLQRCGSKTGALVVTDRRVAVLTYQKDSDRYVEETVRFQEDDARTVDVIAGGVIDCPGRERVVVAYAEAAPCTERQSVGPSSSATASAVNAEEQSDKLFLSVVPAPWIRSTTPSAPAERSGSQRKKSRSSSASQPASSSSSTSSDATTIRFELVSAPTTILSVRAKTSALTFHGVVLFRADSMVAFGFLDEMKSPTSQQCVRLSNEQFSSLFPEFAQFQHPVLCVDLSISPLRDVGCVAFGCSDGLVRVCRGSIHDGNLSGPFDTREFRLNGPITSVSLFGSRRLDVSQARSAPCHVLVGIAIGHARVYEDIFSRSEHDAPKYERLAGSDQYDSVLSVLAMDVDLDGEEELLVGTDDQVVLAYKKTQPRTEQKEPASDGTEDVPVDATSTESAEPSGNCRPPVSEPTWTLVKSPSWDVRAFGAVYSLLSLDVNHDGVDELLLASSTGVYVFECDARVVLARLEAMLRVLEVEP